MSACRRQPGHERSGQALKEGGEMLLCVHPFGNGMIYSFRGGFQRRATALLGRKNPKKPAVSWQRSVGHGQRTIHYGFVFTIVLVFGFNCRYNHFTEINFGQLYFGEFNFALRRFLQSFSTMQMTRYVWKRRKSSVFSANAGRSSSDHMLGNCGRYRKPTKIVS